GKTSETTSSCHQNKESSRANFRESLLNYFANSFLLCFCFLTDSLASTIAFGSVGGNVNSVRSLFCFHFSLFVLQRWNAKDLFDRVFRYSRADKKDWVVRTSGFCRYLWSN